MSLKMIFSNVILQVLNVIQQRHLDTRRSYAGNIFIRSK